MRRAPTAFAALTAVMLAWPAFAVPEEPAPSPTTEAPSAPRTPPVPSKLLPEAGPPRAAGTSPSASTAPVPDVPRPLEASASSPPPPQPGATSVKTPTPPPPPAPPVAAAMRPPAVTIETTAVKPKAEESRPRVPTPAPPPAPSAAEVPTIELLFTYGSEKKKWIDSVTDRFNAAANTIGSGERIRVRPVALGSGELIDAVLSGKRQAHLVSPAAAAFIVIGNAASREVGGNDLVGPTQELASSPVVVAMWRDMAEAIGWPRKAIRWHDIFDYARDSSQWKQVSKPQWGAFRLGHTNPDDSNSGLHALFLEAFAAVDKFVDVSRTDLRKPEVGRYIHDIEKSVPYYETSTGFLGRRMLKEGPAVLSAAIVYENLVIEMNQEAKPKDPGASRPTIVAVYPSEGTFPTEHPVGIVLRPWVTPKHQEAARAYIDYLRARPQQVEAKKYGFRPADRSIPLDDLLKPELGVDASQPRRSLAPPPASAISLIRDVWRREKNTAATAALGH